MDAFSDLHCVPFLGAAHPTDCYSEAVLKKAFWDTGAGSAGPQLGHAGKPRYPVDRSSRHCVGLLCGVSHLPGQSAVQYI